MLNKVMAVLRAAPKPFKVCGAERVWGLCGRPAGHDGHHEPLPEPDEHVAALADQVKLMSRNREPGLHIKCSKCGELLTEPGPLRLHIGTPDSFGIFQGKKVHYCNRCDLPDSIRIDPSTGEPLAVHVGVDPAVPGTDHAVTVRTDGDQIFEIRDTTKPVFTADAIERVPEKRCPSSWCGCHVDEMLGMLTMQDLRDALGDT